MNGEFVSIGIDSIEIARCKNFKNYSEKQLLRIFTHEEIDYCKQCLKKADERFAARFATKEALFKALSLYQGTPPCSFLALCKISSLSTTPLPRITLQWKHLSLTPCCIFVTLTHTKDVATALICLQKIDIIKKLL